MIELITGTPGAGKTTYAVATRLLEESKREIVLDNDTCLKLGLELNTVVTRRVVVAGVRGLKLEHERIPHILTKDSTPNVEVEEWNAMKVGASDEPKHGRLPDQPPVDVPAIMQNWWLWCKPGDLIVIDEAQFVMPRGSLGRKPPYWLQAMEIHRHYGVDFIIITQHPQLIDTTVRALVGMHRHIRSVMGSSVCMVYTWDHASNPERYQMANKSTFVRRSKHYRLFHSSVAHVKPPASGRWGLVAAPLLLVIGLGGLAWKVSAFGGDKSAAKKPAAVASGAAASSPAAVPGSRHKVAGFIDVPKLAGCFSVGEKCQCMDEGGQWIKIGASMCKVTASSFDGLVRWEPTKVLDEAKLPKSPPPPGMSAMLDPGASPKVAMAPQ